MELAGGPVSVTLSPPPSQQGTKLASRLSSLAPAERIYLVLRDMATQDQPGVLYHIYLDLPAGSSAPAKDDPHYVGLLNFYNARAEGSPAVFRSFEVTDLLRNLQKQGLLSDQTTVTIIPSRGGALNANAKPVIGRIELVVQANPS
jgi:tyrosinase